MGQKRSGLGPGAYVSTLLGVIRFRGTYAPCVAFAVGAAVVAVQVVEGHVEGAESGEPEQKFADVAAVEGAFDVLLSRLEV